MTLTRAFEKLRDAGVIVPLAPRPLPHPIPPHFRSHEHCLYHQIPGHDTEHCSALHHAIQDLIDSGVVDLARPSVTTNPLPAHSTHAVPPPPVDMGTSSCSDLAQAPSILIYGRHQSRSVLSVQCLAHQSAFIHTLFLLIRYVHLFILTFGVGTPRFGTRDVFYALHFMHKGLRYVPCLKTTLRPLLYIVFGSSHVGNTRAWLEIISQSMMEGELRMPSHVVMDFGLSWSIVTSVGLCWGIAITFTFMEPGDSDSYGLSVVDSDAFLYTGACPFFRGRSDRFFTLEHLPIDMEIIGLFHVVLIAYWGIAA
ncbi:hypothetical protein CK203_080385 [Vitis vinifera]|uniref:Uncharacterized protein n=1 Tax=Vitis vinifera TaxID=29760 RepID=A0A438F270_VITVI|nr:hypothetical protein CK203_080385 [Vitis vinifera]